MCRACVRARFHTTHLLCWVIYFIYFILFFLLLFLFSFLFLKMCRYCVVHCVAIPL